MPLRVPAWQEIEAGDCGRKSIKAWIRCICGYSGNLSCVVLLFDRFFPGRVMQGLEIVTWSAEDYDADVEKKAEGKRRHEGLRKDDGATAMAGCRARPENTLNC